MKTALVCSGLLLAAVLGGCGKPPQSPPVDTTAQPSGSGGKTQPSTPSDKPRPRPRKSPWTWAGESSWKWY